MHAKSIMFYFVITLIMIFFVICLFYGVDSNNHEEKKVEIALEEKYKTDFLYLDSIIDTDLNTQKYRFHSPDKSMIITAYYDVSYNSGQINIFLPFYKHKFLYDDLREKIHQKCIKNEFGNVEHITLSIKNIDDISNRILLALNDIYKEYNSYNIDTSLHKPFIYLGFKIDLSIKYDEFYETDLVLIKNKLSTLIEA